MSFFRNQEVADSGGHVYWFRELDEFDPGSAICICKIDHKFYSVPLEDLKSGPIGIADGFFGIDPALPVSIYTPPCTHEYVNVGFFQLKYACKHCGVDK